MQYGINYRLKDLSDLHHKRKHVAYLMCIEKKISYRFLHVEVLEKVGLLFMYPG